MSQSVNVQLRETVILPYHHMSEASSWPSLHRVTASLRLLRGLWVAAIGVVWYLPEVDCVRHKNSRRIEWFGYELRLRLHASWAVRVISNLESGVWRRELAASNTRDDVQLALRLDCSTMAALVD